MRGEGAAEAEARHYSDKTHRKRERRNRGFAKHMRKHPTDAEQRMWLLLKDHRFADFKFRRQVPIGPYIADFVCYAARVIIELDGSQHIDSSADAKRDEVLREKGFSLVRVFNNQLTTEPDAVSDAVWAHLTKRRETLNG